MQIFPFSITAPVKTKKLPLREARLLRVGADEDGANRMFMAAYLQGLRLRVGKTVDEVSRETNIPLRRLLRIEKGEFPYMTLGIFHKLCVACNHITGSGSIPERFHNRFVFVTSFVVNVQFFPDESAHR